MSLLQKVLNAGVHDSTPAFLRKKIINANLKPAIRGSRQKNEFDLRLV